MPQRHEVTGSQTSRHRAEHQPLGGNIVEQQRQGNQLTLFPHNSRRCLFDYFSGETAVASGRVSRRAGHRLHGPDNTG